MKKYIAIILALALAMCLFGCANNPAPTDPVVDIYAKSEGTLTHEQYIAADVDTEVTVEFFVQGTQSWWFDSEAGYGKITVYGEDDVGGYFAYEMKCAEEDASKLVAGTKIKVTGYKAEWEGEVEVIDASFEILEGSYIAEAADVTALLGTDDLIKHQNQFVAFKGVSIEAVEYKGGQAGNDVYVTVSYNGASYNFCVESYLTGPDSDTYKAVEALNVGDVVDIEGFLYWYQGVNTHITAVKAAA